MVGSEYWPPAISCNFIDVFGDNLCCMTDELGRLATANIMSATEASHVYPILGEVNNLGNKILFLKVVQPQLAVVIVQKQIDKNAGTKDKHKRIEKAESADSQFVCHLINLSSPKAPHIVSSTVISNYSQLNAFAVGTIKNRSVLCITGLDHHGENRVSFYNLKGKGKLQVISAFKIKTAAKTIALGNESLLVVHDTPEASIFALNNITNSQFIRTVKLPNEINTLVSYGDVCAWSSQEEAKCIVTMSNLRTFPEPINKADADGLLSVEAMAMDGKHILVLGSNEENSAVVPFTIDKNRMLRQQEPVNLVGYVENSTITSKIVLGKDAAFISSGWAGVQVLSINHKGMWSTTTCYGLQRLPIAGLASWSDYLLLTGAELQLYDLSRNKQAKLISSTKLENTIKTIVSAGSYVLCLDKSGVTLRKIEKPENVLVKLAITADQLSYDKDAHKAYLVQSSKSDDTKKKKAEAGKLVELNVYNNNVQIAKTFSILEESYCISADEGYVLVGNLDSLAVYKPDQDNELICKHEFKDLAWREIIFSKGNIFATAIDQNVNGFFLTMSFDGQAINLVSSTKLPHDGVALTVKEEIAFTVGQNAEGNSLLTAIDISNSNKPKILNTKPVLQSASAISTNNNLVIVSGQGFEIFST